MKLIIVVSSLVGGGAERVAVTLANHYVRQGDDIIILMIAGDKVEYTLDPAIELVTLGGASGGNPFAQMKRLYRMRSFFRVHREWDIVSFGTTKNMFTILAALGLGMNVIVSERNDPHKCSYAWLRDMVYAFGRGFVFQTQGARECFSQRIQRCGTVIANPIRQGMPMPYTGKRRSAIAAVGRLEPQKNYPLLLQAFAHFCRKYPEYELHIYGKGSLEQSLKSVAEALSIEKNVRFMGFCGNVPEQIRTSAMYVLSSDYEGMPNSLIEAMALELPCIATDCPIGGPALCIKHMENGILVPVGDAAKLQEAMVWLAEHPQDAEKLGRNAGGIRERLSEAAIAGEWRTFIDACREKLRMTRHSSGSCVECEKEV